MKKKVIVTAAIIVVLAAAAGVGYTVFAPNSGSVTVDSETAPVTQIAEINGSTTGFTSNRYSGIVETEEVVSVKADADKTIKETYVKTGDEVKKGDKLFEYDVDQMKLQLSQDQLDVEQTQAEITSYNTQIDSLEKEKKTATANQQLSLTNQIESLKLDLKKANYTIETKNKEIESLNNSIKNCVVKSAVDGKIQSVAGTGSADINSSAYITIASNGDYRIKAMVSEENISTLFEGDPILIRSRINDKTWTGTITAIDTGAPGTSSNIYGGETTTKYPVYVSLDSTEGLMMGQHVTVEVDYSLNEEEKSGLWLDDYYICDADTAPYVWCDNGGALEKRAVELGDYDEDLMRYQIKSGLTDDDYIAFPEDRLTEGMATAITSIEFEDVTPVGDEGEFLGEEVIE